MARQEKIRSKRFSGVYYRESKTRKHRGRPDRAYWYAYSVPGRGLRWQRVGWASEGITEAFTHQQRIETLNRLKFGEDPRFGRIITLGQAAAEYIAWAESEGKHTVQESNRYDLHIKPVFDKIPLDQITVPDLENLKSSLLKKLGPATVRHIFSLLRRIINLAIQNECWRGPNPISRQSRFKMPRVENKGERFLTPSEARKLLGRLEIRSPMVSDMALVSLRTGLRATEIFGLKGQDLDPAAGVVWLRAKGGRRENVFVDDDLMKILISYGRKPGKLIFTARNGERIKQVSTTFSRAVNDLKLNEGITDRRQKVWFHTLRHTFASWLAQSGDFTLHEIQAFMRHDRIEMTERYAHLIPGQKRDKLNIIQRLLEAAPGD